MNLSSNVSVIIRTYTEARWNSLIATVESVLNQRRAADEIIVVVDHNPALAERVHARFPQAKVVENPWQQGSSAAWNTGIGAAQGELVAFIDDDATADPDWLEQLIKAYSDERVIGVGGAIEASWSRGTRPGWFPVEFDWVVGCTYKGMPEVSTPVRNLIGCNMSFRREVFEQIGGFRKGLGHVAGKPVGCDETEFCIRVLQGMSDKVLLYNPQAKVHHRVPTSRANWRYFLSRCYLEGRSKALVARLVGAQAGLSSERSYTLKTLPAGMWRGVKIALVKRDLNGLLQVGVILGGLSMTGLSYVTGTVSQFISSKSGQAQKFGPVPELSQLTQMVSIKVTN